MKKKYIVTALHGNEPIPSLALASIGMEQIVANPKALSANRRFIDKDMNASFGIEGNSYEEARAKEILQTIPEKDYVLDLHTTSSQTEPFAIIVDPHMLDFALTLGLKHVVFMKHNIKSGHALINYRNGVSVEVGKNNKYESFKVTLNVVENMKKGKKHPAKVYEVFDKITKPGEYINFKKHKDGFIPVLAGEIAYDFYGLKAREIGREKLQ